MEYDVEYTVGESPPNLSGLVNPCIFSLFLGGSIRGYPIAGCFLLGKILLTWGYPYDLGTPNFWVFSMVGNFNLENLAHSLPVLGYGLACTWGFWLQVDKWILMIYIIYIYMICDDIKCYNMRYDIIWYNIWYNMI